jgi:nucleoside-diphosphate-sugar epimerase
MQPADTGEIDERDGGRMGNWILVTGGSGRLGTQVVKDLAEHGHEVVSVDRVRPAAPLPADATFRFVDLSDVGEIAGAMHGCDAVAHLGAIPSPYSNADEVVFGNNTSATFAVLQAAHLLGVRTAVIASSGSAYGTAWSPERTFPLYAPVDEEHPLLNHDAYGLSKEVDERTAEMFVRRDGMSVACLRFHWVAYPEEQVGRPEFYRDEENFREGGRGFWGYVDIRDAARAVRLAIEAAMKEPYGFEPFNIVGRDTLLDEPTEEAIRRLSPGIEIRSALPGTASAYDTSKAKRFLGWEPLHSFRGGA